MIRSITEKLAAAVLILMALAVTAQAATLSPTLESALATQSLDTDAGLVIISFNTTTGLNESHLNTLRGLGITQGFTFQNLGMVAVPATLAQVKSLSTNQSVRSVWSNDRLEYFMEQARMLAGVQRVLTDASFTYANGGLPVSGKGDFSVMVIDSGIDATHNDLKFGDKVVQNVQVITSTQMSPGTFTPLVTIENVPNTDQSVGHGTHCAGIIGGTGQNSGGRYAGVAPGAKIIGSGLGAGLFVINALGAWEWAVTNQFRYNIRVISNSYGSFAPFNPDDPVNIASRTLYDRNVVIVFAGANSGPSKGTWNRYAKAPWVIGVAMGHKEGGLANGSSRGLPRDDRLSNSDPLDDYDAPTITAPGHGREFAANSTKYTAAIISTRSTSNVSANGGANDQEIPVAFVPFYTQIVGTSMATPFVAGTVALMLDADPNLTPDEIKSIITETATKMPGREEWEVGAGFINAYAAVDKVFNRSKNYGSLNNPAYNVRLEVSGPQPTSFSIPFDPTATPGPTSTNARPFTVEEGTNILDVFISTAFAGQTNPVGLVLTDPTGKTYSSGIGLPQLNAAVRQVLVRNPAPGQWIMEARGLRGVTTQGVSTPLLPTSGVAAPGNITGTITKKRITISPSLGDIQGHANQADIELAIINRRMDGFNDGTFRADAEVTRADFARSLAYNVPLRQQIATSPRFTDISSDLVPFAEAVTARGAGLRDFYTAQSSAAPGGLMSAGGATFNPAASISRLDLAVAFIRALGLDAEAKAKANSTITYQGQTVIESAQIPGELRGYVQLAIDKGFLEVYPAEVRQTPTGFVAIPGPRVEPNAAVTRAALATKFNLFAPRFAAGS